MLKEKENTKDAKEKELIITRLVNAPTELVWKAWTNPEQVTKWWGPTNFTIPLCEMDVKPGGSLLIHMKAPDGTIYPMNGIYKELVKPERIVFVGAALDADGNVLFEQTTCILFEKEGNKTRLNIKVTFSKVKPEAAGHLAGAEVGWNQMLDKLLIYVGTTADRELRISRLLNAPVELVWKVWTNPDHIKNWWGPTGFTNTISKMDVKPGGIWNLTMHGPDGTDYKNETIFREIVLHKTIVYEHVSAPHFTATITFEAQGEKTLLQWHMLFDTKEQFIQVVKTFKADEGLKQNIDKLENYLQITTIK